MVQMPCGETGKPYLRLTMHGQVAPEIQVSHCLTRSAVKQDPVLINALWPKRFQEGLEVERQSLSREMHHS